MIEEDLDEWSMACAYRLYRCITIVQVDKWERNRAWNRYHAPQLAKREGSMSEGQLLVPNFWSLLEKSSICIDV